MFETKNVACYFEGMRHKTIKIGGEKYKGTEVTMRIDPLTPALAAELAEMKGVIFRRNDAEPNPTIDKCSFTYAPPPQQVEFRSAPDQGDASMILPEVKVSKFRVRRPSDGAQWVLVFVITFAEISGPDLLWLKEALFEQRFLSFDEPVEDGLFAEEEAQRRKDAKAAKPVRGRGTAGEGAPLH